MSSAIPADAHKPVHLSKSVLEKGNKLSSLSSHSEDPANNQPAVVPDAANLDHKVSARAAAEIADMTAHGSTEEFPDAVLYNEDHGHVRQEHVAAHARPLSNPLAGGRGGGPRRPSAVSANHA